MKETGKMLMIVAGLLFLAGLILWSSGGKHLVGKLPGDISYQKNNVSVFFPITTCILLSLGISAVLWIVRRFF